MTGPVLQGQDIFRGDVLRRKHPVVGQLFTAKAHHHNLSAKVGVANHIGNGTDGNVGQGRVDGHAAAVGVGYRHHAVHIGIFGQQLFFDALHGNLQHTSGALHGGDNSQQIPGTGGADLVSVAHPCGTWRHGQLFRGDEVGAERQIFHGGAFRQLQHMLVDPAARRNGLFGEAKGHAVTDDLAARGNISQCDLMGLGNRLQSL